MTKDQKAEIIKATAEKIRRADGLYLLSFLKLTVHQANNLRREFFKIGVDYEVIKNTLLKRALEEVGGYEDVYPYLVNQTGVVFAHGDAVQPARVLEKFVKTNNDRPTVKACVIEKQVFDGARLAEVAALPTHKDLIAGILGTIEAPAQGIVGTIHAVLSGIVYAIDAIEKQKAQAA
jgi:large subunit ribosomal protein L10